jgi:hypothetical protein
MRWLVVYSPRQIEAGELFHRSAEVAEIGRLAVATD